MATIDPSIALGYKPLQVENPMNQYAAMSQIQNAQNQNIAAQNQNALAQYQLSTAKRGDEKINFLNQAFAKNTDPTTGKINYAGVYSDAAQSGFGSEIPALVKQKQAEDAANVKIKADTSDLIGKKLLNATKLYGEIDPKNPNAVSQYMSIHDAIHDDEDLGPYLKSLGVDRSTAKKSIEDSLKTPGGFERLLMQSQVGAKETYSHYEQVRHNIKTEGISQQQATTSAGQLGLARDKFNFETNPDAQAAIASRKASATEIGKAAGQATVALPGAIATGEEAIRKIDAMIGTPPVKDDKGNVIVPGTKPHSGFKSVVGLGMPGLKYIPGSSAADFMARFEEVQGGAFLQAFNTLKGGGSITETEGAKGTKAITRMSTAQSEKEFKEAAREFQDVIRKGIINAKIKANAGNTGNISNANVDVSTGVDTNNPLLK